MTNEEAKRYLLANYADGDENDNAFVDGNEEAWAIHTAIVALEKLEKIKKVANSCETMFDLDDCYHEIINIVYNDNYKERK